MGGVESLHLRLIEDVLYGFDINRHAIHLAASMLTLSAPAIDYGKMNLYNMHHGPGANGEGVRAGSLDILVDDARYLPPFSPEMKQKRTGAAGYREEAPDVKGKCDLVIMNPPFTRNDIRNCSLPPEDRRRVQERERDLAEEVGSVYRDAIDQTTVFSFFTPIADRLLSRTGTVAIIQPFTACTGPAAAGHRRLLTDPDRFHVEAVVTSHDNRRIYFSENTRIHESLVVARRPTSEMVNKETAFISLAKNPATASDAHFLAEAIRQALDGDKEPLAEFGTCASRTVDQLRDHPWNAAVFYDQSLADDFDILRDASGLVELGSVAALTGGRGIRGAFSKAPMPQNPDRNALWDHKTERQISMRTSPDCHLVAKKGKASQADDLWEARGNLLLVERMQVNLTRAPAVFSKKKILGSAFASVVPQSMDQKKICKAWCVWLNSTLGVLCFLNMRQRKLTYPRFSLGALKTLPVPHPDNCDVDSLAGVFDSYADIELLPIPDMRNDLVRQTLDTAVFQSIPSLPERLREDIARIREAIGKEPTVNALIEQPAPE